MTDFLTQNAGPQAAWNISYDQTQLIRRGFKAAADSSYQVSAGGVPMPIQAPNEYGGASAGYPGMPTTCQIPAMIQYLPQDEQAAA